NIAAACARILLELPVDTRDYSQEQTWQLIAIMIASLISNILAVVLILCTMRARNGYRGLHEFLSGTCTYQLRWPRPMPRRSVRTRPYDLPVSHPAEVPQRVGAFRVRGAVFWTDDARTLLAEDPQLGRNVLVWMRLAAQSALDTSLRDISRA